MAAKKRASKRKGSKKKTKAHSKTRSVGESIAGLAKARHKAKAKKARTAKKAAATRRRKKIVRHSAGTKDIFKSFRKGIRLGKQEMKIRMAKLRPKTGMYTHRKGTVTTKGGKPGHVPLKVLLKNKHKLDGIIKSRMRDAQEAKEWS